MDPDECHRSRLVRACDVALSHSKGFQKGRYLHQVTALLLFGGETPQVSTVMTTADDLTRDPMRLGAAHRLVLRRYGRQIRPKAGDRAARGDSAGQRADLLRAGLGRSSAGTRSDIATGTLLGD